MDVYERLREILDESISMGLVLKSIHEQLKKGQESEQIIMSERVHYLARGVLEPAPHILLSMLLQ